MNGLPNALRASGPTSGDPPIYRKFGRTTKLMRQLQKRGMLRLGYQQIEDKAIPMMVIDKEARAFEETRTLKDLLGLAIEKDTFNIDAWGDRPVPNHSALTCARF